MPPRPHRPRCGLTLLELAIVLAVLALLASMAAPAFGTLVARHRLRATAENLAADLSEARFEAARRQTVLHLAFRQGTPWCYAIASTPDSACDGSDRRALKSVRADNGVTLVDAATISFDPGTGASLGGTAGHALLASARGERLRVQISPLGRPAICAPDGPLAGTPRC